MKTAKDTQKECLKQFGQKFPLKDIEKELNKYVKEKKLKKKKIRGVWYYYEDDEEEFLALTIAAMNRKEAELEAGNV